MKVIFLDGKSSKPISAYIENKLGKFHISYTDEDANVIFQSFCMDSWKRVDYNSDDTIFTIENNSFPPCKIIFKEEKSIAYIKNICPDLINPNLHQQILSFNTPKVIAGAFASLFIVIALYIFVVSPLISSQVSKMITINTEISLGEHFSRTLINTLDINDEKSTELMRFYHIAGFQSKYPIKIMYADENTVNAFAIPGGKIVIFKGLLDKMESAEELAGLIGHELAHVEKRHSLLQISNKLSTYLLISILTNDTGGLTTALMEHTINFRSLKNSRSFEKEADLWGLMELKKLHINQNGMVSLFEKIKDSESDVNATLTKTLEYMSSHPLTEKRIEYLKASITDTTTTQNEQLKEIFDHLKSI